MSATVQQARYCPGCPSKVPCVSPALAQKVTERARAVVGDFPLLERCVGWLTNKGHGIDFYLGIIGRAYTHEEKVVVESEVHKVAATACPFAAPGGCVLGGLATPAELAQESRPYGWLPTLMLRAMAHDVYVELVKGHYIPDCKVALVTRREKFVVYTYGHAGNAVQSVEPLPERENQETASELVPKSVQSGSH